MAARYRIIDKLGQGGMGIVFRAVQVDLNREVALKVLRDTGKEKSIQASRFLREAKTSSQISHPNIIRILDFGEMDDGQLYYTMELLQARDLDGLLKEAGPLAVPLATDLLAQAADALAHLHEKGIIHRDIKPANMMVDDGNHLVLMDFGLVKVEGRTMLTEEGRRLGTPRFMAPELFGMNPEGPALDVYSLGISFWELIAGCRPYPGETMQEMISAILNRPPSRLAEVRSEVPAWLSDLVERMVAKSPSDRPEAAAVRDACRSAGTGRRPQAAGAAGRPSRSIPRPGRTGAKIPAVAPVTGTAPARQPPARWAAAAIVACLAGVTLTAAIAIAVRGRGSGTGTTVASGTDAAASLSPTPSSSSSSSPLSPSSPSRSPGAPGGRGGADGAAPGPAEIGRSVLSAIREVAPARQIEKIHKDLVAVTRLKWFKTPPVPAMVALRARWKERLAILRANVELDGRLAALARAPEAFFGGAAATPSERLDVYLALHELLDLELYCRKFGIPFTPGAAAAIWPGYGQQRQALLPPTPAICMEFDLTPDHATFPRDQPPHPDWKRIMLKASERFHGLGDARGRDDLMGMYMAYGKTNLEYRHPDPLPLPPLEEIGAIELAAMVGDLHENNRFVVSLSTDGQRFKDVAVLRGLVKSRPMPFWHPVERGVLSGAGLWLRVRLVILPEMAANTEKGLLPRLVVAYRSRRAPGR
jgi:serine/threonine-protein kinase